MLSAQSFSLPVTDISKALVLVMSMEIQPCSADVLFKLQCWEYICVSSFPSPAPGTEVRRGRKPCFFLSTTVFSSFHKSVCYIWRAYSCIPIQFIFITALCLLQISSKDAAESWALSSSHVFFFSQGFNGYITLCYDTASLSLKGNC